MRSENIEKGGKNERVMTRKWSRRRRKDLREKRKLVSEEETKMRKRED